jgi:hypothetical protein
MRKISRRDFFKATGAAGLGAALPAGARAHGDDRRGDDDSADLVLVNGRIHTMDERTLPGGAVRSRPLCAYPKTAQWTGVGSTDEAANFACVDGRHDAADFKITGPGSHEERR